MKWKVIKKGNKYIKRPKLEVEEWVILMFIALGLNMLCLALIFEGL